MGWEICVVRNIPGCLKCNQCILLIFSAMLSSSGVFQCWTMSKGSRDWKGKGEGRGEGEKRKGKGKGEKGRGRGREGKKTFWMDKYCSRLTREVTECLSMEIPEVQLPVVLGNALQAAVHQEGLRGVVSVSLKWVTLLRDSWKCEIWAGLPKKEHLFVCLFSF